MTTHRKQAASAPVSCFTCQVRQKSDWCVLTEEELKLLDTSKSVRTYEPGETIFHEGDPCVGVYCVESGLVAFRKYDAEGEATLLGLANPGRTLGYRSLLEGGGHIASAEVVKPSRICFIEKSAVRNMLDHNPALGYQFLQRMAKDLGHAAERYHQAMTLSVRARFVHLLLVLGGRYTRRDGDTEFTMELPLSRQDLAALIGTRPETLARTIRQMEDEGIARFAGRVLHVPDIEVLFDELGLEAVD